MVHCKENQLLLTTKNDADTDADKTDVKDDIPQKRSQIKLIDICREATPTKCNLNPFLFNGHMQTAYTTMTESVEIPIYYKRKIFEQEIPHLAGQFAVDFVVPPYEKTTDPEATDESRKFTLPSGLPARTTFFSQDELAALPSNDSKPMLIALHGLTGGSHEVYLRATLARLLLDRDCEWEACVINARGCAQTKISTSVLFNARATWDVRQLIKWLRKSFPNRPLFGIGFSLGANILANVCSSSLMSMRREYQCCQKNGEYNANYLFFSWTYSTWAKKARIVYSTLLYSAPTPGTWRWGVSLFSEHGLAKFTRRTWLPVL